VDTDVALVSGILLIALSIPAALNGWTEGSLPRFSMVMSVAGLGLVGYAMSFRPTGYGFEDVPVAFVRVFAMIAP
jgi:formate-dependent nitrite reductase membrane component NrfD